MNLRHLSVILLATNLALVCAIIVLYSRLNQPQKSAPATEAPVYAGNTVTQISVRKFNATNLLSELASRRIGWKSIESTNYVLYIFNLRSIGCPEETVRDIIIADIAKLYSQQREELRSAYPPLPYWRTLRHGETLLNADPQFAASYQALDQQQRQLVQDLLGVDYHSEVAKFGSGSEAFHPVLSFLPLEKQAQVRSYLASTQGGGAWMGSAGGRYALPYQNDTEEASGPEQGLSSVLSPEELRLFELYTSGLAEQLRHELYGFEPSQAEFDQVYRVRKAFEGVLDASLINDPDLSSERKDTAVLEAETALNAELGRILGKDRFAAYRKATDPDWQVLTGQMAVSEEVASQIYSMKQQAALQKQRVEYNPSLTLEQRQAALMAIRRETQNTLAGVLGSGAYDEYRRLGGDWLANLDRTTADAVPPATSNVPPPPLPPPVLQPTDSKTIIREIIVPEPVPVLPPRPGSVPQ